jgi:hypothetical protein
MKDLDNLKTALHTPPPEGFAALDTGAIMSAGKRIRRRRRVQSGAGLVAVAAAVVLVVTGVNSFKTETPVVAGGPSLTTSAPPPLTTRDPAQESRVPLGDVIATGIFDPLGERVFYLVKVDAPVELPDTHFGLMAGHRAADGTLSGELMSNEFKGSDRRPGFHVVDGGEIIRDQFVPVSGYYVGPVEKISSTVQGKPVQARLAQWSEDPSVVVFWFIEQDVASSKLLTPPVAFGKNSAKLPS